MKQTLIRMSENLRISLLERLERLILSSEMGWNLGKLAESSTTWQIDYVNSPKLLMFPVKLQRWFSFLAESRQQCQTTEIHLNF